MQKRLAVQCCIDITNSTTIISCSGAVDTDNAYNDDNIILFRLYWIVPDLQQGQQQAAYRAQET